jgi:PTS system ascorbate-specific IIC component
MMAILDALKAIFSNASVLVGLIALVGLLALKKPFEAVVAGTLKTIIGFIIIGGGAGIVVGAVSPLGVLFNSVLAIPNAGLPVNEVFVGIVQKDPVLGPLVAWAFLFAFIINILIARFSPWKYIFLTGHHTLFAATLTVGMFAMIPAIAANSVLLIAISALITGVMMVLFPALSAPFTEKVIGSKDFVMGHFGTTSYVSAGFLGQFVGKPEDSAEKIKFPAWIGFMREPLVAMGFVMLIIFVIVSVIGLGKGVDLYQAGALTNPWWLSCFVLALTFAGGIGVILLGVRTVLGEIVPAFRGISLKIVPQAVPALDCPVVFPYAPNALLIGYLTSIVGGLIAMFVQMAAGGRLGAVILPSMIIHFFVGGTAGIYGNATGGWKGAVLGGIVNGLMFTFLAGFTYPALAGLNPAWKGSSFGDTDFGVTGSILAFVSKMLRGA